MLSHEAVERFYQAHQEPNTTCVKDGGSEDVEVANCLRTVGVYPGKSVDEHNRERFHALSFSNHFNVPPPSWLDTYNENKPVSVRRIFIFIRFRKAVFHLFIFREQIVVVIQQYLFIMFHPMNNS